MPKKESSPDVVRPKKKKPGVKRPGTPVTITHKGITDSIGGWAERLGINPKTLHSRIARQRQLGGDSPELRAIENESVRSSKKTTAKTYTQIRFNGVRLTIARWAEELGVSVAELRSQHDRELKAGTRYPWKVVLQRLTDRSNARKEAPAPRSKNKPGPTPGSGAGGRREPTYIDWKGESLTAFSWAKRLGVSPGTIYRRIENGMSGPDALAEVEARHSAGGWFSRASADQKPKRLHSLMGMQ
jgi:hypothetical protein